VGTSRIELRKTFESVADRYDAARPSYPAALYDDLVESAALVPGARLLEIGCGTGKSTAPLLERGFRVVCVELGSRLAAHARANLAGRAVDVHVASFEGWHGEPESFELVYAATAWRWVDPAVRYRKAFEALRPGGHLAFWNATHGFPEDFDPFFSEIQDVYDEIGESHEGDWPPASPESMPDDAAEIEASGLFDLPAVRRYVWEVRYSADEYIALLDTFSGHIAMDPVKRERLYGEVRRRLAAREEPVVRRHWSAILHVARRSEVGRRSVR
jgi:SAM-dependent methyltransferase